MGFFKKKSDPISDRSRTLNAEIAALEAKIKKLEHTKAVSGSDAAPGAIRPATVPASSVSREPVFEPVDRDRLKSPTASASTPEHYNDLGVRKYDLASVWERWRNFFRGSTPTNPKLINYLAAGSIQGLRPMRYEKRVARNRAILLCVCLLLAVWAIFEIIRRGR